MSYTKSGSGKSMARLLAAVVVVGVMLALDITAWRSGSVNASWAAIIASVCALLGSPWVVGKMRRSPDAGGQP